MRNGEHQFSMASASSDAPVHVLVLCFRLVAPGQPKLQTNLLLTKVMFKTSNVRAKMQWLNQVV